MLEPIGLEEAKQHLKVTFDNEDVLISTFISAARNHCENELGLTITETNLVKGDEVHPLPPVVISAMLIMTEYLYRRDDSEIPGTVSALLALSPYRYRLGVA